MVINLVQKKKNLQDQIGKKKEKITSIQDEVNNLEKQIQDVEEKVSKLKYRAAKEEVRDQQDSQKREMEFEEAPAGAPVAGDGAISTAALDASSTSAGNKYGGWRHYSKIGEEPLRRKFKNDTEDSKKKKKKKITEFVDYFFGSQIEEGE